MAPDTPAEASRPELVEPSSTASKTPPRRKATVDVATAPTPEAIVVTDLWQRIRSGLQLQDHYQHPRVEQFAIDYAADQALLDLISERARPFLFSIVQELERREMPMELALLPAVESTFDPLASSGMNAAGLWQFMPATGLQYGLRQDWWYDGRLDPVASTSAALDYLQSLNQRFDGDWLLTLAAYNAGGGNVNRAIRRHGEEDIDFFELRLPQETRYHVPRLLALAKVIESLDDYALELAVIENTDPLVPVLVGAQIDLSRAAELSGIDYAQLRRLNAGFLQWATHPQEPQTLYLPPAAAARLSEALADINPETLMTWDRYKIVPGDTLTAIARRHDTSVAVLQQSNRLRSSRIVAGEFLLIPRGSASLDATPPAVLDTQSAKVPQYYTVRSGDSLWLIANRFQLGVEQLRLSNDLGEAAVIHPGLVLNLGAHESGP